ncbi:MAG TPA: hypothetical protein VJZ27_01400, partial [Aggregatilineales bacterium]|nr:hypothetical protein [Aggregatilineales bacterium]
SGSGDFAVDFIADPLNEVFETPAGEANNFFQISYRVDYNVIASFSGMQLNAGTDFDLAGGTSDIRWTGGTLEVINGARIGIITGVTFESANFDVLNPGVINSDQPLNESQLFPGVLIGVITAEGQRAVIRLEARVGTALTISFRVYAG